MKRKVLLVGKSSLAVSLPSKWAKAQGIKQGDEVEINQREGHLEIARNKRLSQKEISVKAPESDKFVRRVIVSPYIQGYDTIHVTYNQPETYSKILEVLNHLTGFELVSEKKGRVTFQNVAQGIPEQISVLFKRVFHLLEVIGESLMEATNHPEKGLGEELEIYEHMINKIHHFGRRLLNSHSSMSTMKMTATYRVLSELEGIGDLYKRFAKYVEGTEKSRSLTKYVAETNRVFQYFEQVYWKPTLDSIADHRHQAAETTKWLEKEAVRHPDMAVPLVLLSEICSKTREITIEIIYPFKQP